MDLARPPTYASEPADGGGMSALVLLIPVAFCLGLVGLLAFLWSLRSGQYEDLSGAAERVLLDEDDVPMPRRDSTPEPLKPKSWNDS